MNIARLLRLFLLITFAFASKASAQTVRDQLKNLGFHVYAVIFGLTVDAGSRIRTFHVSKVTDPKSGTTDAVDVKVPQSFVDAARKKAAAKHYDPKLKDGKPVEFFTYY